MLNEMKSRLSRIYRGFLSGKKILMITVLTIGLINAQGITNTLGGNTAAEKFIVENSDSEAGLVVTGEGNVGIGTTNPLSKLSVGGDGHLSSTIYSEAATGGNFIGVYGYASDIAQTVNYGGHFTAVGSNGRGVHAYGKAYDFYAAGPGEDYGSASSIRWKRNIVEIDNPLEKLAELRGVYFDWDEEHGGHHDVGMIAEEVGKVLPEIVVYEAQRH